MNEGFRLDQLFHSRPKGVFFFILLSWWQTIYSVLKTSVFLGEIITATWSFIVLVL